MMALKERLSPVSGKEVLDKHSLIMTIDGSTTAGKRVLAEKLADRYGLTMLNTGNTIRALSLLAIEHKLVETDETNVRNIPPDFGEQIVKFYESMPEKIRIEKPREGAHTARIMVGERDMHGELLTYPKQKAVENLSSIIAASPAIRWKLYQLWRQTVSELGGTIVIGRKTGVDLFPNADIKLYLFASPEASAAYRVAHDPMAHKGIEDEQLYVRLRDGKDREMGLLDRPAEALVLDTSNYIRDITGLSMLEKRVAAYIDSKYVIR